MLRVPATYFYFIFFAFFLGGGGVRGESTLMLTVPATVFEGGS